MPLATKNVSEALVSVRRIQAFLELSEVESDDQPIDVCGIDSSAANATADGAESLALRLGRLSGRSDLPAEDAVIEARSATYAWPAAPVGGDAGPSPAPSRFCECCRRSQQGSAGAGLAACDPAPLQHAILLGTAGPRSGENIASSSGQRPGVFGVDFSIRRGECVCVIGPVGSGKSSLISALLGQLKRVSGAFILRGSIAYVPQQVRRGLRRCA